jgi:N-acetylmuramoyl-L-alanine amidase
VKDQKLGVLNHQFLGAKTKACLVELEFIDVPAVDMLLNIGPKSSEVRQSIATAIAGALLEHLPEKTA